MKLSKIICLCAFAFCSSTIWGAEEQALVVEMKDGATHEYFLNDKPELSYSGGNLDVLSQSATVSYSLSDIAQAYFDMIESSAVTDAKKNNTFKFRYLDNSHIEIYDVVANEVVSLFDVNGRLVGNYNLNENKCTIDLTGKSNGVYVVKVGNKQAIKVIKR